MVRHSFSQDERGSGRGAVVRRSISAWYSCSAEISAMSNMVLLNRCAETVLPVMSAKRILDNACDSACIIYPVFGVSPSPMPGASCCTTERQLEHRGNGSS